MKQSNWSVWPARPVTVLFASVLAGLPFTAGSVAAQSGDARWLPWLGCWEADGAGAPADLMVCVSQQPSGVEIATITDGQTESTRTLIADGQTHPLDADGCDGWQVAQFSKDGRRVFLRSELTCEGGVTRTASGVMAITSPSIWLDAQSIGMDGESVPRVVRYRPASTEAARAAGFTVPVQRTTAAIDARLLASADLSIDDVIEAAGQVDGAALQAFVAESGQRFDLNADQVVRLADSGVPEDVIDMIVAVSYPERFAIDRDAVNADMTASERPADRNVDRYDPFGWGGFYGNRWNSCFDYGYRSYYCDPYLYGYGAYGYGYGGFGYAGPIWGYSGRPTIVVVGGNDGVDGNSGHAVRGKGYTRGGASSAGTASGRTTTTSRTTTSRTSSGTSRTGSGSSTSSGSSRTSTGRTAHRRGGGGGR